MLPLLSYRRAEDKRSRSVTHAEEGTSQEDGWKRLGGVGEVRRESLRGRCIGRSNSQSHFASK